MTIYTIRPNTTFSIVKNNVIYVGGDSVDLTAQEFEVHKHKLEGVESTVEPLNLIVESCFPDPWVTAIIPNKLAINTSLSIEIKGSFFTPETTTVTIAGSTVDSYEFIDSSSIVVGVTTGNVVGRYDLTVNNGNTVVLSDAIELSDLAGSIVDLRSGKTAFDNAAIELRAGMSWERTPYGLAISGSSGWSKWVRFVGDDDAWVRSRSQANPPSLNLIFQAAIGMVGYGSRENNPTSTRQWQEGEIMGYLSATYLNGFYGNDGTPGNTANFAVAQPSPDVDAVLKLTLANFGEPGGAYKFSLISEDDTNWQASGLTRRQFIAANSNSLDWLTEQQVLVEGEIASNMTADAASVMPFLIPNSVDFNLMGFYYL